jgi:hypothetical protein
MVFQSKAVKHEELKPLKLQFKFLTVESGSREKCERMKSNSHQCDKKVTKFILPMAEGSNGTNLCEAHFQIALAKAEAEGMEIVNINEEEWLKANAANKRSAENIVPNK